PSCSSLLTTNRSRSYHGIQSYSLVDAYMDAVKTIDPPDQTVNPASAGRFGAYLYTQFFSAFNDNVHFFAISLYLTSTASATPEEAGTWQAIAGAAFVFPFILFSPFAGTLAD